MSYRDTLYANYSASFGEGKTFDPAVQFAQYEATYQSATLSSDARILDVGCGKGEWLAWMHSKGFHSLTGVDGSPADLKMAAEHLREAEFLQGHANDFLATRHGVFDLIHGKDVAEHMTKDEFVSFLNASLQALRPQGQLWLLTFNAQAPLANATRYGDFTHENGLTPRSAAQCLRACGFDQIAVRGMHYCSSSLSGRIRRLLSLPMHAIARLMLQLRHGSSGPEGMVDVFTPLPDMLITARRP